MKHRPHHRDVSPSPLPIRRALVVPAALLVLGYLSCSGPALEDLPLTRETTFYTEPLRGNGSINYPAALNQENRITPETNAAIPLNTVLRYELPPETLTEMGSSYRNNAADSEANVFVGGMIEWNDYAKWRESKGLAAVQTDELDAQLAQAMKRAWTTGEFPVLATWLDDMEPALTEIERASRLEGHWIPASEPLFETPIPNLLRVRNLANALRARAMHRLDAGDTSTAWSDLETLFRFSYLISGDGTLISVLIGDALMHMGLETLPSLAARDTIRVEQLETLIPLLRVEARLGRYVEALNTERLGMLDMIVTAAKTGTLDSGLAENRPTKIRGHVPWGQITTDYNRYYDLLIEAVQAETQDEWRSKTLEARTVMNQMTGQTTELKDDDISDVWQAPDMGFIDQILYVIGRPSIEVVLGTLISIATPSIAKTRSNAVETRAWGELSSLYLSVMATAKTDASYPAPNELSLPDIPLYRIEYHALDGRFVVVATPTDPQSIETRSFCMGSDGSSIAAKQRSAIDASNARCLALDSSEAH